jgi:transcriptional regulator GlxA family with amidase domain
LPCRQDRIASVCGFGSAHRLRTHFNRVNRVAPREYQQTFRAGTAA